MSVMSFFLPIMIFLFLDQLVKHLIRTNMELGQSIPVVPEIFHITYIENAGAAFGILANQRLLFLILTIAIIGIMLFLYQNLKTKTSWTAISFELIISGAIGNFIDRLTRGTVTDFLDFQIWPVFNIADICICIGIALLCYLLIFKGEEL